MFKAEVQCNIFKLLFCQRKYVFSSPFIFYLDGSLLSVGVVVEGNTVVTIDGNKQQDRKRWSKDFETTS
jgi:hypothetical protein